MNQFESTMNNFQVEAASLQEKELKMKVEADMLSKKQDITEADEMNFVWRQAKCHKEAAMFQTKFMMYLKEQGLQENFTLPELCNLVIKKAKESTIQVVQ